MQTPQKNKKIPAVLAVVLGLSLSLVSAETFPMPTGLGGDKPDDGKQPFDPNPAPGSPTSEILTYGKDGNNVAVPLKTIRLTNNSARVVYPMMRNPNIGSLSTSGKNISIYNPWDPADMEYRGYIGYKDADGKYYFGLKPGKSILVKIPLVFWNGGRICIGTDGKYLTSDKDPNPSRYRSKAKRMITAAEKSADTIPDGVVMWYRSSPSEDPAADSEDQLAEWTIRDHGYLTKIPVPDAKLAIPDNQLVTLINYDVSNVDSLYLPVAMQVNDTWVIPGGGPNPQRTGFKAGEFPEVNGWTGAINDEQYVQDRIHAFTAPDNKLLGQYFGGKGWPYYNIPNPSNDPKLPIKIPSGANIFPQSPLLGVTSSYTDGTWQGNKYLLSSGGTGALFAGIGWAGTVSNPAGSTTLNLNKLDAKEKIDFVEAGQIVAGRPATGIKNPIAEGTKVVSVDRDKWTVELSKPLVAPSKDTSFDFSRPTQDYAAEAMIRLWYSWAQYYLKHWKDSKTIAPTTPIAVEGSIDAQMATLTFSKPHPELVPGMAVTGPGLDNTVGESGPHQGKAVILKISSDSKSVIVSRVANAKSKGTYQILPPQELLWTPKKEGDPGYPLFGDKLRFEKTEKWQDPYKFAQAVYLVMASMNQIDKTNNSGICKFMQDVIGANMGYIVDQAGKESADGQMVIAMIRDLIKSVLRGVTDFTEFPDDLSPDGKTHLVWYPDPSIPTGGQKFNVFNLDPFVWFVHVKMLFSGYGFSVDDDTANIGAGGANHIQFSIAGENGLKNKSEWSNQVPFGPVGKNPKASGQYIIEPGDFTPSAIKNVSSGTPITVTTEGQHSLKGGTEVYIDQVVGNKAANGTFRVDNVTNYTFELFDLKTGKPVASNGTYAPAPTPGRWSLPPSPYIKTGSDLAKVYFRVAGDDPQGVFTGTIVSVDGKPMDPKSKVRVRNLGRQDEGRLILSGKLKYADGTDVPAGTYDFVYTAH